MKKALCAAMALTLTMATAAPAFAVDTTPINDNISITQNYDNAISPRLAIPWSANGSGSKTFYRHGDAYKINFSMNVQGTVNDSTSTFSNVKIPTVYSYSTNNPIGVTYLEFIQSSSVYSNGAKSVTIKGDIVLSLEGKTDRWSLTLTANAGSNKLSIS